MKNQIFIDEISIFSGSTTECPLDAPLIFMYLFIFAIPNFPHSLWETTKDSVTDKHPGTVRGMQWLSG